MSNQRFERQMRLFGKQGQERLWSCHVAVVGIGGVGTHVVQQLALLGVGRLSLIDSEEIAETDLNRYIGARHDDPIPGTRKVDLGERMINATNPEIRVGKIHDSLVSDDAFRAVIQADYVFGCLDCEGARLILDELCAAYSRPYFDLATDIVPGNPPSYGGRVCVAWDGHGCIACYGLLDIAEAQADLATPSCRRDRDALYGVRRGALERTGPSVVSINGAVASLAVTEFMVSVSGIRSPRRLCFYRGDWGKPTASTDEPIPDCYYCKGIRGRGDAADLQRYIREGVGAYLR
jgi:hypothetical protein